MWRLELNKKDIIIFTGPSLHPKEAMEILEADYRPPVARGDIERALNDHPKIIGVIDGVFHQQPAVSHKELIKALDKVIVVGGASMGALRASELDELGMKGVGYIYKAYREGEIESDDDVAVTFHPVTFEQLSEALVNMQYNFKKAEMRGIITKKEYTSLIKTAKSIYYPKRTYDKVFHQVKIGEKTRRKLKKFLQQEYTDLKKQDALSVLDYIKKIVVAQENSTK